jgi:DNA-binding IclR family transcriptional regulator
VAAVLRFLAAHPDRAWSHAELSRELDVSAGTLHGLLVALADRGLLLRTADKRYRLGAGILTLAAGVVDEPWRAWEVARPQLDDLSRRLELPVYCSALLGDDLVVLGRALPHGGHDSATPATAGTTNPFIPPLGRVFVAWADDAVRERWLARGIVRGTNGESRAGLEASLRQVRDDGYDLGLIGQPKAQLLHALATLDGASSDALRRVYDLVHQLDAGNASALHDAELANQRHHVHNMTAPVFGPRGAVVVAVAINSFPTPLDDRQIQEYSDELLATARGVATAHAEQECPLHP